MWCGSDHFLYVKDDIDLGRACAVSLSLYLNIEEVYLTCAVKNYSLTDSNSLWGELCYKHGSKENSLYVAQGFPLKLKYRILYLLNTN